MAQIVSWTTDQIDSFLQGGTNVGSGADGRPYRRHTYMGPSLPHLQDTVKPSGLKNEEASAQKSKKMGTFNGVFLPTTLNVLSILMFLRFGFILGQAGFLACVAMLMLGYMIDLLTVLSISAISTNGTVKGGGAYYMISRSLGPEFGGSIGIIFYLGLALNAGMNCVGFIEPFVANFGRYSGESAKFLPEGGWWNFFYASLLLVVCTGICFMGSSLFSRASTLLFIVLMVSTLSIPISTLILSPFEDKQLQVHFTGLSFATFKENLMPRFTIGASGSQINGRETFQDVFALFFAAFAGIFAGASMSGNLKDPSRAIPKGLLFGLLVTFLTYLVVLLCMAASITRSSLYADVYVLQKVNVSKYFILAGELSTSFFSALLGVIGAAKLLQAIARDHLLPVLDYFAQGTAAGDEPTIATLMTYLLVQLILFARINMIASFVTIFFLLVGFTFTKLLIQTFLVTNIACFALRVSSAPNFRPSFHFFNAYTAAFGVFAALVTMFLVDGINAAASLGIFVLLFFIIHYVSPPKSWGDVSQSLIYFSVRKYLLRLRQEHVKFWRPQILLLVNDPPLKKGALYILGHVIIANNFHDSVHEAKKQNNAWSKFRDISRVKAFVQVSVAQNMVWAARNLVLLAGLGGMRPNIVVMGFVNMEEYRQSKPLVDVPPPSPRLGPWERAQKKPYHNIDVNVMLPTDTNRTEQSVQITEWVQIIEDLLLSFQINVAIAKGFSDLEVPRKGIKVSEKKKHIDLWPIPIKKDEGNVYTTNFDTYTLILQLGCILHTVPVWQESYNLRVVVFVEHMVDANDERGRVQTLLKSLRIPAELIVLSMDQAGLESYECIVNGSNKHRSRIDTVMGKDPWWLQLSSPQDAKSGTESVRQVSLPEPMGNGTASSSSRALPRSLHPARRRRAVSQLQTLGVSLNMQSSRLQPDDVDDELDTDVESSDSDDDMIHSSHADSVANSSSTPIFSGSKVPRTQVENSNQDDPHNGATISFAQDVQQKEQTTKLSFNDCSARAQYLMINELMQQQSQKTAVLFTTLPAPAHDTWKDEGASVDYVGGLELLCESLPPTLLVHSKSLTVTTAL